MTLRPELIPLEEKRKEVVAYCFHSSVGFKEEDQARIAEEFAEAVATWDEAGSVVG